MKRREMIALRDTRRIRRITLSPETLSRMLGLTEGLTIIGVDTRTDPSTYYDDEAEVGVNILVHHRFFESAPEGIELPTMVVEEAFLQSPEL